jgi:hypothetical protein
MVSRALIIVTILIIFQSAAAAQRFALLIGNSSGKGDYATLKYVENDINRFKSILGDFCGFEKNRITTLYNGTPEDLDKALTEIAAQTSQTKNSMFLFYYSGHADEASLKMGAANYSLSLLKEKLTSFPSDIRIGIFDACQSGSFTRLKGGTLSEPFLFKDDAKTRGQVFLSSSSVSENAQEFDAYQNSVFTFHFINGLRGSGDISGDNRVTLSEAYQYAFNHTVSSTAGSSGGIQHPSYQFRIQGEGDIVLADLNIRTRGVLLQQGLWGDLTIINEQSAVVADLTKDKKSAVVIALSPGIYRIIDIQNAVRREAKVTLPENSILNVNENDFSEVRSGEATKKGLSAPKPDMQLGMSVSGVYERFRLSSLASSLTERFREYSYFGISPAFSFPSSATHGAITIESVFHEQFIGRLGIGWFSDSSASDYVGTRLNDFDNTRYGARLHCENKLSVIIADASIGYRFPTGYLKNWFLMGGLSLYITTLQIKTDFTDSLFNTGGFGDQSATGVVALPFLSVGYSYPVSNFCDIGAELKYRYLKNPQELNVDSPSAIDSFSVGNKTPLKANFKGIECRLFVTFNFKFRFPELSL